MTGATVERRLAAIVATDVVGYSRLIETDEAGTLARLADLRRSVIDPAVAAHHGRIVKEIGDGLLIEFVSVVEAVRCGVEIQDGAARSNSDAGPERQIQLRIGVNVGDVVVEGGDIFGDGVNIAARLEALAEPGSIYLSQAARDQLEGKLALSPEDLGEQQLKNIARPVRVFRLLGPQLAGVKAAALQRQRRVPVFAIVSAIAVFAAGAWWLGSDSGAPKAPSAPSVPYTERGAGAERLSARGRTPIAVLPFANLSGDEKQDYFSDGLTEEIIGGLGRFSSLSVVARNAVMPFKRAAQKPDAIARSLGVRYLVEGSARRAEKRVRVSVQLSDPSQGRILWTQQFDSHLADVFATQDEITRRIVGALAVRVTRAEQERVGKKATESLEAYDLVLRARSLLTSAPGRRANVEARTLLRRAIELDPRYSDAHAGLGVSYIAAAMRGWASDPDDALSRAEAAARKAIEFDDRNAGPYALLGRVMLVRQQYDSAESALRRALELNPSDAEGYYGLGDVLLFSGEFGAAIELLETGWAYDPKPQPELLIALPLAYYMHGRYRDCVNFIEGKLGRQVDDNIIYVVLAMAYGQLGQAEEARAAADLARRRNPIFDPQTFGTRFRDPAHQAKVREGLRKAGLN